MQYQTIDTQKRNWPIIMSVLFILLAALYCSVSAYATWSGNEGIYTIRRIGAGLANFTLPLMWISLTAFIILWIMLMGFSHNVWDMRIIILLAVFTSIFVVVGFVLATLNPLSPVDTVYVNDKSYYLSYYYNASDNGFYDLVECNNWGIVCNQIWIDKNGYPEIDKQAQLETNENTRKLAVIIEGKTVNSFPLD